MSDYDFHVLSSVEFEAITQDLLQLQMGISLENFTTGRDGGVDLRASFNDKTQLIVQCKHYKTYASLKSNLKKEVKKVRKLKTKPDRYVLVTSAPITPGNADDIKELFEPYIKSTGDMYGRDRLNTLIRKFPSVEEKHYKLWLASVPVMEKILHAKIVNQSQLELKDIERGLRTYVENDSFIEALEVLKDRHFVIISGLPGIGKTTLAQILTYRLLGKGDFEELVYLSADIRDAYELYKEGTKQLFLFDDFLGRNFLSDQLERNEDNELVKFIRRIQHSPDKALIMTTREYILNQAQTIYEIFGDPVFTKGKYIIDLSTYTKRVKALILYNHISISNIPPEYLATFLNRRVYQNIIKHRAYNPRLIEIILDREPWKECTPEEFPDILLGYFDNPESIWIHVFENQISQEARDLLKVLFTATAPMEVDELIKALSNYLQGRGQVEAQRISERALKELEGTFITIGKYGSVLRVDYQSPAVHDFLAHYYEGEKANDLVDIIERATYLNQLTEVFTLTKQTMFLPASGSGKILVTRELREAISNKIIDDFFNLGWSAYRNFGTFVALYLKVAEVPTTIDKLTSILFDLGMMDDAVVLEFCSQVYRDYMESPEDVRFNLGKAAKLLIFFKSQYTAGELETVLVTLSGQITTLDDTEEFDVLQHELGVPLQGLYESKEFKQAVDEAIESDIDQLDYEELLDYMSVIEDYIKKLGLDRDEIERMIDEQLENPPEPEPSDFYDDDDRPFVSSHASEDDSDKTVDNIFDELRGNS